MVLTGQDTKDKLKELRKTEQFFCPQCEETVHLKIGQIMIPHFAHQKKSTCAESFSEGETTEHLLGKQKLYEMFQKLKMTVQLEPYLKELAQRPDILLDYNKKQFAIEYQCSTIPIPHMEHRTRGYHQSNIKPIWILKTPINKLTYKNGIQQIKLSPFKQQFISYIQGQAHMITFDAESGDFVYFSYLMPISGYRYIALVKRLPIEAQRFPFLQVEVPTEQEFLIYWKLWKKARLQFLKSRLLSSNRGVQDTFLRACYDMRYQLGNLPLFVGIPVSKSFGFSVFNAEWQLLWIHYLEEIGKDLTHISSCIIHGFREKYPNIFINKQAIESIKSYNEIIKGINISKINSAFDEEMLYRHIYVQFLAKH
ncbi:competence protein CoiA [Rummeliibacillus sp. JY-2-4R]